MPSTSSTAVVCFAMPSEMVVKAMHYLDNLKKWSESFGSHAVGMHLADPNGVVPAITVPEAMRLQIETFEQPATQPSDKKGKKRAADVMETGGETGGEHTPPIKAAQEEKKKKIIKKKIVQDEYDSASGSGEEGSDGGSSGEGSDCGSGSSGSGSGTATGDEKDALSDDDGSGGESKPELSKSKPNKSPHKRPRTSGSKKHSKK